MLGMWTEQDLADMEAIAVQLFSCSSPNEPSKPRCPIDSHPSFWPCKLVKTDTKYIRTRRTLGNMPETRAVSAQEPSD
ncbi:MAG: hypothetical protein ACJA2D_001113 [Pseudohongiellaceae bacterium]|jgi:hypothetical protein